jgi:hypothetical protein
VDEDLVWEDFADFYNLISNVGGKKEALCS